MQRSRSTRLLVYALLILGTIIFSFPFVWMMASSTKVDRELYPEELTIFPQTPIPRQASPYVDDRFFADLPETVDRQNELLPGLVDLVRQSGFVFPDQISTTDAESHVARGLFKRLAKRLPPEVWSADASTFLAAARPVVDRALVESVFIDIHRFLAIGSVQVRFKDSPDIVLLDNNRSPLDLWSSDHPELASLHDETKSAKRYARVDYQFTDSDTRFSLTSRHTLPCDADQLLRVQVDLRPDDSWHTTRLILEHSGRRFTPVRDTWLGNFEWTASAWQHPSEDDNSTKIRNWVILRDIGPATRADAVGSTLYLTFEVDRSSHTRAWSHKLGANYLRVLEQIPFWRYVRVSLFLVIANVVLNVIFSSLIAYAFARLTWPGRDICFILMLATMMIPSQVTMIPHFVIWKTVGSYNSLDPLWLGAAFGNAFHIFLLRQFMKGIPKDLEDSARIDGCGFLRVYWHVILPLIGPSLAAIAIFTFMGTWNDFMGPLLYIADQRLYPLAFGLYAFNVQVNSNPALNMAGSVLMTLPVIAIFFFAQRYFIQGVTLTGMKG